MNETLEFTNLCMVRDGDRVLVMDRKKEDWPVNFLEAERVLGKI